MRRETHVHAVLHGNYGFGEGEMVCRVVNADDIDMSPWIAVDLQDPEGPYVCRLLVVDGMTAAQAEILADGFSAYAGILRQREVIRTANDEPVGEPAAAGGG